jgi:hypothetical protein
MKYGLGFLALSALLVPEFAFASTFAGTGSILRVDEGTYRVQIAVSIAQAGPFNGTDTCPDGWTGSCCFAMYFFLTVSGPFGVPTNVSDYDLHEEVGDGFVSWIWSNTYGAEVQFDFAATGSMPSSFSIDFGAGIYWEGWCTDPQSGHDTHLSPADDFGGGRLHADLPTRVGDSAPLRPIPVSVETRPWSAVKQLYR